MSPRLPCLILCLALIGCTASSASSGPSASIRSLGPGEQWLIVADWTGTACAGTGLLGEYRVHGSPNDPHLAWMTYPDGSRRELAWAPGTSARFVPGLEVVGPDGDVVAREGWMVVGSCLVGSTGFEFVELAPPSPEPTPVP